MIGEQRRFFLYRRIPINKCKRMMEIEIRIRALIIVEDSPKDAKISE